MNNQSQAKARSPSVWGGLACVALCLAMTLGVVAVASRHWIEKKYPDYKGHTGLWHFCTDGEDTCPETDDEPIPSKWETGNKVVRAFGIIACIISCYACIFLSGSGSMQKKEKLVKFGGMGLAFCACLMFLITWAVFLGISPKKHTLNLTSPTSLKPFAGSNSTVEWAAKDSKDGYGVSFWMVILAWILSLAALVCIALHKPEAIEKTHVPPPPPPAPFVPPPPPVPYNPAPAPAPTPENQAPPPSPETDMRPSLGCGIKWLDEIEGTHDPHYKDNVCVIENVEHGGAAERAGLGAEDILKTWNGAPIQGSDSFRSMVMHSKIGETINLGVVRPPHPQPFETRLTLGAKKGGVVVREHVPSSNTAWSGMQH